MFEGNGQIDLDGAAATGVAAAGSVLSTMASIPPAVLSDEALASATLALEQARRVLVAAELSWLAELDRRGTTDARFGQRTVAWLAHEAKLPRAVASARVGTAAKVASQLPGVGDALREGHIGFDHARVLADAANPRNVEGLAGVTAELCDAAQLATFARWQAEVRGLADLLDADGGHDPHGDLPEARISAHRVGDVTTIHGQLSGEGALIAESALDQVADELFRQYTRDAAHRAARAPAAPAARRGVRRAVPPGPGGRRRRHQGAQDRSHRRGERSRARPRHRRRGPAPHPHRGAPLRPGAPSGRHHLPGGAVGDGPRPPLRHRGADASGEPA
jgi:hypothetical protein